MYLCIRIILTVKNQATIKRFRLLEVKEYSIQLRFLLIIIPFFNFDVLSFI